MTTGLEPSVCQTKTKIAMPFYLTHYVLEKTSRPRKNLVNKKNVLPKIYKTASNLRLHSYSKLICVCDKECHRDFPGGPVAETPCSQCRDPGFDPWSGN